MSQHAINGESFEIQIDGRIDAPVLLLSNSLSSDLAMWDGQIAALSADFRIVRYDQRGHGASVVSPPPYSIGQLGRDAIAILDHLGIAKAHWCGLSMGGMVGMWVLANYPTRFNRAVLANTAAHMGPAELWNDRIALAKAGGMEATVEPTVRRWFPNSFHEAAPEEIDRMRRMIRRTPVEGYVGSCLAIRDMDQRESIRSIKTPVLVVIGDADPATTPEAGALIHQAIANSRTCHLDAAHISNVQRPREFNSAVLNFLKEDEGF